MTATASTVPTIYEALHDQLVVKLAGRGYENSDVMITYGGELVQSPWDHVVLGNVNDGVMDWAHLSAGRKKRTEDYHIMIGFHAVRPGGSARDSMEAAYANFAILDGIIADNPDLGLDAVVNPTLVVAVVEFKHQLIMDESSRGWRCHLDVKLNVNVRLS